MTYPVHLEVHSPARFDRVQLALRLAVGLVLGAFGITFGWIFGLLYAALPALAAIAIGARGASSYRDEAAPRIVGVLEWLVAFHAYMMLLTDRFPVERARADVRLRIDVGGRPTVGSALVRLLTSIPLALAMFVLAMVGGVLWVIGVLAILFAESQPDFVLTFQRVVLRWQARWLAYHASLVEPYPPFHLDAEEPPATSGTPMAAGQR